MSIDACLEGNPVFVVRKGESFRLRIKLMHESSTQMPIREIIRVSVAPPDAPAIDLPLAMAVADNGHVECEAVALFDPTELSSNRLLVTSPPDGSLQDKYVPLALVIVFGMSPRPDHAIELKHTIYCKIVSPDQQITGLKFGRNFDSTWERVPHWKRDTM